MDLVDPQYDSTFENVLSSFSAYLRPIPQTNEFLPPDDNFTSIFPWWWCGRLQFQPIPFRFEQSQCRTIVFRQPSSYQHSHHSFQIRFTNGKQPFQCINPLLTGQPGWQSPVLDRPPDASQCPIPYGLAGHFIVPIINGLASHFQYSLYMDWPDLYCTHCWPAGQLVDITPCWGYVTL